MRKNIAFFLAAILVLMAAFIFVERAFAPSFQKCIAEHPQSDSNSAAEKNPTRFYVAVSTYVRCSGRFIESHNGAFTALSTFIIAAFTGTLWIATTRQAELTKEALIADKRAFIFTNSLNGFWEQDPSTGLYNWRFRALWQNSGDTPTRHMVMHVACELRNAMLPPGFNFNYPTTQTGTAMLAPKSSSYGGIAPMSPAAAITRQDILDVQQGRKFLYLWAWARYFDVFPGTPQHITRFCWPIAPPGNPLAYTPCQVPNMPNSLSFGNIHHTEGTCADEECLG